MHTHKEAVPKVIDNLRRIFQAINEYSKAAVHTTGLTGPQLWALKILESSSPLRVSELAQAMYLRSATVVGIVDRLEAKELVSRVRSATDRRAVELSLTDLGKKVAASAPDVAQTLLISGLAGLTNEQFQCIESGMQMMVTLLKAEQIHPQSLH